MKDAIKDLTEMRNFSERKRRTAHTEKDRERYSHFKQAYEGAIKIVNKYKDNE